MPAGSLAPAAGWLVDSIAPLRCQRPTSSSELPLSPRNDWHRSSPASSRASTPAAGRLKLA